MWPTGVGFMFRKSLTQLGWSLLGYGWGTPRGPKKVVDLFPPK